MSYSSEPGPGKQSTAVSGIQECFLKVIGDLETDIDWCINRNAAGVSLTLRLPAKSSKGTRPYRRHLGNPVNKDTLSVRDQDHTKTRSPEFYRHVGVWTTPTSPASPEFRHVGCGRRQPAPSVRNSDTWGTL
jgi:hypothetical protein